MEMTYYANRRQPVRAFSSQMDQLLSDITGGANTPSGAVKEVILRVTERAQKEVRVGLGFGRCCP
jgi:hypothetical protein